MRRKSLKFIKSLLLPVLGAAYPVIFLYSHNAQIAQLSSVVLPLVFVTVLSIALFALFLGFQRRAVHASLSALAFLALFNVYGTVYTRLVRLNLFQVEHYTLLPFFIVCAFYLAYFVTKIKPKTAANIQNILLLLAASLVIFNLAAAAPAEIQKRRIRSSVETAAASAAAGKNYPDIYYIVFDEYAGFKAMREYWKYDEIDQFVDFLKEKGFFVAENSQSETTDTLNEMTSRLNLTRYPKDLIAYDLFFKTLANNKVMQVVKSYGYTTVVFDGPSIPYKAKTKINADYNFAYDEKTAEKPSLSADEFAVLFFDQTMARAFSYLYAVNNATTDLNQNMILYSLDKAIELDDIPGPKFVYLHVMLPHMPIMFDENGRPVDVKHREDWTYYLGQHKYATKRAQQLIERILAGASPQNPPVVILQSDHGARNHEPSSPDGVLLPNYEEKYMTMIMNALYLPGYDYAQLRDDLPPIETFVIVLNHYLDAGVGIDTYQPPD